MSERAHLAAEIVVSLLLARRALRRSTLVAAVTNLRGAGGRSASARECDNGLLEARRLSAAVMRTLTLMPGDTRCLMQSLVLTRLLARRRISATLVVGARIAPDFAAHAWVEHAGEPLLPTGDAFGRLVEL
jgi:Transglutaminase-like superfamily